MGFVIVLSILLILGVVCFIFYDKYKKFITDNSIRIKKLRNVNASFNFKYVELHKLVSTYDNENYYYNIDPIDYLTYELVYIRKEVKDNIEYALYNRSIYDQYMAEVHNVKEKMIFESSNVPKMKWLLSYLENNIFNKSVQRPVIDYKITCSLILTNINGRFIEKRIETFYKNEIERIIKELNNKVNNRYVNRSIWDSICKVERGKVSNKLRFAIYSRDGYRCVKCGRKNGDLEIDHIIPVSKGGKTEYSNLQTLCKRCNMEKSNMIEAGTMSSRTGRYCKVCGAPLRLIKGKYGEFYGCVNYPNCTYKENK